MFNKIIQTGFLRNLTALLSLNGNFAMENGSLSKYLQGMRRKFFLSQSLARGSISTASSTISVERKASSSEIYPPNVAEKRLLSPPFGLLFGSFVLMPSSPHYHFFNSHGHTHYCHRMPNNEISPCSKHASVPTYNRLLFA